MIDDGREAFNQHLNKRELENCKRQLRNTRRQLREARKRIKELEEDEWK